MNLVSEMQIGETTYIIEHSQNDAAQESVESKLTRIIFREIEHISNIQTKIINSIDLKSIQKHRQSNEYGGWIDYEQEKVKDSDFTPFLNIINE